MKTARIIVGANYGDEGKGTVTAHYAKNADGSVLNILTNGGAQRGHSIVSEFGSHTFQHFGSGTYYGAANYYSRFFILNPMQFVKEYHELAIKPDNIYRHKRCRWSTPYDMMANAITEELQNRHASCGMGIWNTIKRFEYKEQQITFDCFVKEYGYDEKLKYLRNVKLYYEFRFDVPSNWKALWDSNAIVEHFLEDCNFMYEHTISCCYEKNLASEYDNLLFENGQGLLLSDTGEDRFDKTPSNTGNLWSVVILRNMGLIDAYDCPIGAKITSHYVTRPYLTRHGDGELENKTNRNYISSGIGEDRTNKYNKFQGDFRYGYLNLVDLYERINKNAGRIPYVVELTHCDEIDKVAEFKQHFDNVNVYDKPEIE